MERKRQRKPQGKWKDDEEFSDKPCHVYNGKIDKLESLTLEEFRARPEEHLEPDYQYPYSTYESYDGDTGTFIARKAGAAAAAADVSDRKSSTSKHSSTSKGKNQDKGKSVAK